MILEPHPDAWMSIPGNLGLTLRGMYDLVARSVPTGGTIVQLGCGYGASLAYLRARMPESARLVGVDTWSAHYRGYMSDEQWDRVTSHGNPYQACLAELANYAAFCFGRVTLVRGTSEFALGLFAPHSVYALCADARVYDVIPWTGIASRCFGPDGWEWRS